MRRRVSKSLDRIVKTNLKYQTKEFFGNSTLHGVRYIAEEGRSFIEKFMWFCLVAIGAVSAFVIIASLWEKFQTNPTITGLDTDFHNQQLDFPTVTVCPTEPYDSTIVNETAIKRVGGYEPDAHLNIPMLQTLTKLSYGNIKMANETASEIPTSMKDKFWAKESLRYWAFIVADTCKSVIESCKFKNDPMSCCDEFKPIYSERGFCYSFNARYYSTEHSEEKLKNFSYISDTDRSWSLGLQLKKESKVYMHSVDEVFSYDYQPLFTFNLENSIDILFSMKQTYTTEDTKQLTVNQRKCIFADLPSDYKISYYKNDNYSLSACMKECRMNNALKLCKCIPPFYAPANIRDYKYCGLNDLSCLSKHAANITNLAVCWRCQLSCLNTVYDIEKSSLTLVSEQKVDKIARINIEFLTWPIIRYKREVLFGWVDLLVSFGGIAGLFLGFSLLSGVELLYYFSVRACCMVYKNRQRLYEVQEEEDNRPFTNYDISLRLKFKRSEQQQQQVTNIQMVEPVASDAAHSSSDDSVAVDRFDVNQESLAIPRVNVKYQQDSSRATDGDSNVKINTRLLNNRAVDGRMNELPPPPKNSDEQFTRAEIAGARFQPASSNPYSRKIKPLDKNYRQSSSGHFFYHGYLP